MARLQTISCGLILSTLVLGLTTMPAYAQDSSFIARYQARVSATQAEQPHWVTPLVTVTPRLEQEFRADFVRQTNAKLVDTWNFGNSKGLELIPAKRIELLFNLPPYLAHDAHGVNDGWGDVSFNSKYRFFARNEEHGNAIVTGFLRLRFQPASRVREAAAQW